MNFPEAVARAIEGGAVTRKAWRDPLRVVAAQGMLRIHRRTGEWDHIELTLADYQAEDWCEAPPHVKLGVALVRNAAPAAAKAKGKR